MPMMIEAKTPQMEEADEQSVTQRSCQPRILKKRTIDLEFNDPDITVCACRCISYCSCDCDRGGVIS